MSETAMWLFPVTLSAVLALFIYGRLGVAWTWGFCLQQLITLVTTLVGFYFIYFGASQIGAEQSRLWGILLTIFAWMMFISFNISQRAAVNKMALDLSLLRIREANNPDLRFRLLIWGPPAQYWRSMAKAMQFYHQRDNQQADAIIDRWNTDPRVPQPVRESLLGFSMLGRIMQNDWDAIIERYEAFKAGGKSASAGIPLQMAARAYAERQRYEESFACLRAMLDANRFAPDTIDINFVPFFALSGGCDQLRTVVESCKDKESLPEYSRVFWQARCAGVRGEFTEALRLLETARQLTPPTQTVWLERVDRQTELMRSYAEGIEPYMVQPANPDLIMKAQRLYEHVRFVSDLLRPAATRAGLVVLIVTTIIAFVLVDPYPVLLLFANVPQTVESMQQQIQILTVQKAVRTWGILDFHLWDGQWWRLITYMFMHGNTAHLVLNIGGLYIFGKSVENFFGTAKFYVIYFLSGILSGLLQLFLVPYEPCVGASGAIMGVFGAAIAAIVRLKNVLPDAARNTELRWMLSIAVAQVLLDEVVNGWSELTDKSRTGTRIAAFAHAGGIAVGFMIGMVLPLRKSKELLAVDTHDSSG